MFLIMSADYISPELKAEFGGLPPCFLPLGNRRLFHYQIKLAPSQTDICISLPESFEIPEGDQRWLSQHNIKILTVPDGLSLGASLVAALNMADFAFEQSLHVLYGDTLINPLPQGDDLLATAEVEDNYNWAVIDEDSDDWLISSDNALTYEGHQVITGYFKFSDPRMLIRCITQSNWNFLKGLAKYRYNLGLRPVEVKNWLDFGHANTFYHSKSTFTTQRVFNELKITPQWVEKSGHINQKIQAEANWFENLPPLMRQYTPQFLGTGQHGNQPNTGEDESRFFYRLEYLHHTALNELFVFSEIPVPIWRRILQKCLTFLNDCQKYETQGVNTQPSLADFFRLKTSTRLLEFAEQRQVDLKKKWRTQMSGEPEYTTFSIVDIEVFSAHHLPSEEGQLCLVHGDFCFSNILYDFRTNRIKVIDPRGISLNDEECRFGDIRYDIAKLAHSVIGQYDWIIAGYYTLVKNLDTIMIEIPRRKSITDIQEQFIKLIHEQFSISKLSLYAMQVQLFLSMLPLHHDDPKRQDALLANAFRLHHEMLELTA